MLHRLRHLLELIRFSHTLFALPFALLSAVMAWTAGARSEPPVAFRWLDLAGILVCMVFARSAAMAFNRLADRRLDAINPRTRSRHLPAGLLTTAGVVAFTAICSLGFVAGTAIFLVHGNWIPLAASAPVLALLFGYSYAKRVTTMTHLWLGTALGLAPLAAWVAIRGEFALAPVMLGAAVMFWVAGFDVIYACQDVEFDVRTGLHSIPARLGVGLALQLAAVCHLGMVVVLVVLPLAYPHFGTIYLVGVALIGGLLLYEHSLVRPDDLGRLNRAFFHVNAVVSLGLLAAGCLDLYLQ